MSQRAAPQELDHDPMLSKKFSHLKITSRDGFAAVQEFAISILHNRKLAQHVRHVTLDYDHWANFPAQALPYTAGTDAERQKEETFRAAIAEQKWEAAEASELLNRLMTTESPGFNQRSSHQLFPDAVVALLLPMLPNVGKWTVGDVSRPPYVGKAIQRAKDGIFGSISVTHLEILAHAPFSDGAWGDYSFHAFNIFQNLPRLQKISGKGIGGIGIEDSGCYDEIPSEASGVREIHLKDCELGGGCLSNIIGFSKGLSAFTYRFGGRAGDGGTAVMYTPQLAKALTPHRLTMRSLDIDTDRLIHESLEDEIQRWEGELKEEEELRIADEDADSNTETLDSADSRADAEKIKAAMRNEPYFPNLTNLRIGIKLALRFAQLSDKTLAQWLPASLEEIEIVGYRKSTGGENDELAEVISRREELLPILKTLKGVEEYIENGQELDNEEDYVHSDEDVEEDEAEEADGLLL